MNVKVIMWSALYVDICLCNTLFAEWIRAEFVNAAPDFKDTLKTYYMVCF